MGQAIGTGDKKSVNVELNIVPFIDLMSCLTAFLLVTAVWVNLASVKNEPAGKAKSYEDWRKEFAGWLFRTQALTLYRSPSIGVLSRPGESEREFRIRLQQSGREQRDAMTEALRQKYAPKIAALQERSASEEKESR